MRTLPRTTRHLIRLLAFVFAFAAFGAAPPPAAVPWLFVSDIHLNPIADSSLVDQLAKTAVEDWDVNVFDKAGSPADLSPRGQDTNPALFRLTLLNMSAQAPEPAVVIIPGDFLVHQFRDKWDAAKPSPAAGTFADFALKTIRYMKYEFAKTFPKAQFVIALGNNDSVAGDYNFARNSQFRKDFARIWEPLVNPHGQAPDFASGFYELGDYRATLPNGTVVIVVNSNVWSPCTPENLANPSGGPLAQDVMTSYTNSVAGSSTGATTWVLLHIPPGIDAYAAQHAPGETGCNYGYGTAVPFYAGNLATRFGAVRAKDGQPPALIIAGHLHNDTYRVVGATPLMVVPSISPIHYNNPAFFIVQIDPNRGNIADYTAYSFNYPSATSANSFALEYDFDRTFMLDDFSQPSLSKLHDDKDRSASEMKFYDSGAPNPSITDRNRRVYWCANDHLDPTSFTDCRNRN